jgi:hypothetical protein
MGKAAKAEEGKTAELQQVEGFPIVKPFPPLKFDFLMRSDEPEDVKGFLDDHRTLRELGDQVMIFAKLALGEPQAFMLELKKLCDGWQGNNAPDLLVIEAAADKAGGTRLGPVFEQTMIVARMFAEQRVSGRRRRCQIIDIQRRRDQTVIPPLSGKARGFYLKVVELLNKDRDAAVMLWNDISSQADVSELLDYDGRVNARTGGIKTTDYIVQARDTFIPAFTALGHADPKVYFDMEDLRTLNEILLFARGIGMMRALASGKTQAA